MAKKAKKQMSTSQRRKMSEIMKRRWADAKRAKAGIGVEQYLAAHQLCEQLLEIVDVDNAGAILTGIKDRKDA